jgi:hypothetical protein
MDSSVVTPRTRTLLQDSLWYAAAAASVGAIAPVANAQIVYTNLNPDVTIADTFTGTTIAGPTFDLNADGTDEILIAERGPATSRYGLAGFDSVTGFVGNVIPYGGEEFGYFLPLAAGTAIGPATDFLGAGADASSFGLATFTFGGSDPNGWRGTEAFIGLRFDVPATGATHYGWMRLQFGAAGNQIIVKDYAFQATPNTAIAAGAMGVATEPDALADGYRFSPLAPNPTTGVSSFELTVGQTETVRAEAFDALGRSVAVLHDGPLAAGQTSRLTLDAADLPAGVYVVRVTGDSFVTARRVTVAH